jgi:trimeric autotransporter adhesin
MGSYNRHLSSKLSKFFLLCALFAAASVEAASFNVNSTTDASDATPGDGVCETATGNGICTLRAAVQEANALFGTDTINVPAGTFSLGSQLYLSSSLSLVGASNSTTIIQETVADRVIAITSSSAAIGIENLTIQNSGAPADFLGGGISIWNSGNTVTLTDVIVQNNQAGEGAGIYNGGSSLTLVRTIVRNNSNVTSPTSSQFKLGGGIYHTGGSLVLVDSTIENNFSVSAGGLFNMGTATIISSTISGNTATNDGPTQNGGEGGGGIVNGSGSSGTLKIVNSTISGNKAHGHFGGIYNANGTVKLANVTITENIADSNSDGYGNGGGIAINAAYPTTVRIQNSILAGNLSNGGSTKDCTNSGAARIISDGYNLLGNNSGCAWTANTGDSVGSAAAPILPMLGALANNGGPTKTHALIAHGPAIDTANPAGCGDLAIGFLATDQRGVTRAVNGGSGVARCDRGAFEFNSVIAIAGPDQSVQTGTTVMLDGSASTSPASIASYSWTQISGSAVSLNSAMTAVVSFTAPSVSGTLTLRLTVTDTNGDSNSDDVIVNVAAPAAPPVTGGGGGGCAMIAGGRDFDPILPLLLIGSALISWRRWRQI